MVANDYQDKEAILILLAKKKDSMNTIEVIGGLLTRKLTQ